MRTEVSTIMTFTRAPRHHMGALVRPKKRCWVSWIQTFWLGKRTPENFWLPSLPTAKNWPKVSAWRT